MAGTWKFNVIFALFSCIIALFSSLLQNSIWTSTIRALIAFVVFFIFAFIIRWMIAFIQKDTSTSNVSFTQSDDVHVEQMIENLNEEEQEKVAEYIRQLLNRDEK
ncbi:hypothetical protein NSS60_09115 [Anoxybacillus sp. FSL W8-0382]|uniref:hypothetical protein n=1 Tax=Anoxybacillus TaxID=150247 RepID=UPI000A853443|nr:hypothetical protein [Anoxybacillus flavithermus]ASA96180.1 hypothetical protein CA592_04700 [Anoxybacillus flavithermus]MBE2904066.1 hypothetical protein [Anoxybacillus flavithermus]MBE2929084.1 hypothetical protein [Anoxybacillus flavithermus]MBE2931812.1 hypothetical protein [Anoxybacillus flavithermus]MBE2955994.1 hypothetical protein [Anoxybacillus flavithermus]